MRIIWVLILMLAGCGEAPIEVFSARTSPNGLVTAENIIVGNNETAFGRIVLRTKDGQVWRSELINPEPEIFLKWADNEHLEFWAPEWARSVAQEPHFGNIQIVPKFFERPKNGPTLYDRPNLNVRRVVVAANEVVATATKSATDRGRFCNLTLNTRSATSYDNAEVVIAVGVETILNRKRPLAGISTHFTLSDNAQGSPQSILTSATISGLPSTNWLPTGANGMALRGQFLGENAMALIQELKKPSITLDFSRNFFDQIIKYEIPLLSGAPQIKQFETCLGDVDYI